MPVCPGIGNMTKKKSKKKKYSPEIHSFRFAIDPDSSDLEAGKFRGIASVFGSVIETYPHPTIVEPGAFKKTIQDRGQRVKILFQHDEFEPWIGLPTLLEETEEGLLVEVSLNQTKRGQDVANAIRHAKAIGQLGAIELSIGFDAIKYDFRVDEAELTFRHVLEIRLWEISVVNFGADRSTHLTEAASIQRKPALESPLPPKEPPPYVPALSKEIHQFEREIAQGDLAILTGRYLAQ